MNKLNLFLIILRKAYNYITTIYFNLKEDDKFSQYTLHSNGLTLKKNKKSGHLLEYKPFPTTKPNPFIIKPTRVNNSSCHPTRTKPVINNNTV